MLQIGNVVPRDVEVSLIHIHREGQGVEILQVRTARIDDHLTSALVRQAEDLVERRSITQQMVRELGERLLAFADEDVVGASGEVRLGVIGGV